MIKIIWQKIDNDTKLISPYMYFNSLLVEWIKIIAQLLLFPFRATRSDWQYNVYFPLIIS